ncbi:DUF6383 domain-containing protein [Parabacteroides sp. AM08-6]|uniref:DUF6383 domain-containing protein n=1 Tax=Parabacteroides sp. AM08-6 TaxID=2292053 RepID=UPI000EFE2E86|nr:DUF6383 domain-containing protein [Parabacteroides sp. AM08-6]RHJ80023.1 hypothetical protein DW103_13005 [Parabacteroides sp. AM08-6]
MNKKFSTLMAGLVLASGVAMAHNVPGTGGFPYRTQDVKSAALTGANAVTTIQSSATLKNAPYYQLADGLTGTPKVLVQVRDANTGKLTLKMVDADKAPIVASLWSIEVKEDVASGKQYTFRNKETGLELVFDHTLALSKDADATLSTEAATLLDGCTMNWAWSDANKFTEAIPVYSAFHKDSVMVMQLNDNEEVVAVKYPNTVAGDQAKDINDALKLRPVVATGIVLKAADINSMIDAVNKTGAEFKFNKNGNSDWNTISNNVLADNTYMAEELTTDKLAVEDYYKLQVTELKKLTEQFTALITDANTHTPSTVGADALDAWNAAFEETLYKDQFVKAFIALEGLSDVFEAINGLSGTQNLVDAATLKTTLSELQEGDIKALTVIKNNLDELTNQDDYANFNIRLKVKGSSPATYYMVDTVRNQEISTQKTMKLSNKEIKNTINPFILARFNFRVTYFASNDSLSIEPLNASSKTDKEWNDGTKWDDCFAGKQLVEFADVDNAHIGLQVSNTVTNDASTEYTDKHVSLTVTKLGDGNFVPTAAPAALDEFKARISFKHEYPTLVRTTTPEGVYLINLVTAIAPSTDVRRINGTNLVADMGGHIIYDEQEKSQEFSHMPAAQWVIEHLGCADAVNPRVRIVNREYGFTAFEGQLYDDGNDNVYIINHQDYATKIADKRASAQNKFCCEDTLKLNRIEEPNTFGYLNPGDKVIENTFKLKQFFDYGTEAYYLNAVKSGADTLLRVQAEGSNFELIPAKENVNYGYSNAKAPQLKKSVYKLKVKDADKINNDRIFVGVNKNGKFCVADTLDGKKADYELAYFTLKENNHWTKDSDNHYYALVRVDLSEGTIEDLCKLAIEQGQLDAKQEDLCQDRTESFILESDTMPYYRRIIGLKTEKFYSVKNNNRTLGEANEKGVNYLDIFSVVEEASRNNEFFVDTARVTVPSMPTYLLALDVEKKQTAECTHEDHPAIGDHYEVIEYLQGRYMLDASYTDIIPDYVKVANYENVYTRYVFVNAIHYKDALYIMDAADATIKYDRDLYDGKNVFKKITLNKETYDGASIAFRLKEHDSNDFYLETRGEKYGYAKDGNTWVKEQNQTIVSTGRNVNGTDHEGRPAQSVYEDIYQALLLNTTAQEGTTDNDEIAVSETVKVIAGNGEVTIYGAAGKKVKVYGLLGQEGKATILSSDMQTISAPSGIVIIAVEGEKAVKTIVK